MNAMKKGKFEISEMVMNRDLRISLYYNDDYLEDVRNCLKRYLHLGYFDELE